MAEVGELVAEAVENGIMVREEEEVQAPKLHRNLRQQCDLLVRLRLQRSAQEIIFVNNAIIIILRGMSNAKGVG